MRLVEKLTAAEPTNVMVRYGELEPLVVPTQWDILGVTLHEESMWKYGVEAGFT